MEISQTFVAFSEYMNFKQGKIIWFLKSYRMRNMPSIQGWTRYNALFVKFVGSHNFCNVVTQISKHNPWRPIFTIFLKRKMCSVKGFPVYKAARYLAFLICTLISENQGLEKSRSVSYLRKISGPAHLDFFSVCHLDFFFRFMV